jgi:hypothetical protein
MPTMSVGKANSNELESESRPLVGGSNGRHSRQGKESWFSRIKGYGVVILIVLVAGLYFLPSMDGNNKVDPTAPPPPVAVPLLSTHDAWSPEDVPKVMYRPFCLTHGDPTARILQTSMGSPSQQWTHLACYAQSSESRQWAARKTPNVNLNGYGAPDAIMQLNLTKLPHRNKTAILGFGAAFTEAAAVNYNTLSHKGKETLMELFFGKSGLGYSLGRVHINSCDFSLKSYDFDDTDGDFELNDFDMNVTHDRQAGMTELISLATSIFQRDWSSEDGVDGHFKMYASPWSPPAWMKQPTWSDKAGASHAENMTGSTEPTCLRDGVGIDSMYAKSWALYFSKFITACKSLVFLWLPVCDKVSVFVAHFNLFVFSSLSDRDLGIPFWAVTVQNEPEFPAPWEACAFSSTAEGDFIANHLGPQLALDHPDVHIFMFDHNKDHAIAWAHKLLNKAHPASKYIRGTAIHWYAGGMVRLRLAILLLNCLRALIWLKYLTRCIFADVICVLLLPGPLVGWRGWRSQYASVPI